MTAPRVQLLWWAGCPSYPRAREELRAVLADAGLDPDSIEEREVPTDDAASAERFVGSPTIRIDGRDVSDPGDDPVGLTCRVYRLRDGRISPTPDPADIRAALGEAGARRAGERHG